MKGLCTFIFIAVVACAPQQGIASNLYGLHEMEALGYKLVLTGETERNGAAYWEVTMTEPGGETQHIFLDKNTFLIGSDIETSALHPDADATEVRQETFYNDYRETGGLLFAERSVARDIDMGKIMQTTVVTMRTINPILDEAQFKRPLD